MLGCIERLLSESFLSGSILFWSFGYKELAFEVTLFVCSCWFFSVSSFFGSKSGLCEAKRKPKITTMLFQVSMSLCSRSASLLHFSESYVCFVNNVHGFSFYLVGRRGRSMSTPSSWKQKSPD